MDEKKREIKALDLDIKTPFEGLGVAYYRLPKELKDFFEKCEKKHGIAGFEWEVGSWNFGIILKEDRGTLTKSRRAIWID